MGVTLCVTSFACTAPFLGAMIAAGVQSGGQSRLLLGMGVFGLTMALPFVLLSLMPSKLPKGGGWMNSAKILFGFIELAAALKFFSNTEFVWNWRVLPREMFLLIWGALFVVAGLHMLGQIKLKGETGEIGPGRLATGSAVIVLACYFLFGAMGNKLDNFIMYAFEPPYSTSDAEGGLVLGDSKQEGGPRLKMHTIVEDDFDRAVSVAQTSEKLLLLNFTGLT